MKTEKDIMEAAEKRISTMFTIEVQKVVNTYTAFLYGKNTPSLSAFGDTAEEAINNVIKQREI